MNGKLVCEWEASTIIGSYYMNGKLVHEWEGSTRMGR